MTRYVSRSTRLAACSVAVLSLAGCIKVKDEATVEADGSGSYKETVEVDLAAMEQLEALLKDMIPTAPDGAGMDGAKPPAPKEKKDPLADLKEELKRIDGLEIVSATAEEKDRKSTVRLEAKFTSLEVYAKASQIETGAELVKNEDGSYTLKFDADVGGDAATPEPPKPGGGDVPPDAKPEDPLEKAFATLELARTLTLPGTIVETNGTKGADGSTVTWRITYEDIKKGKKDPHTVTFKGEDLDLKPFKVERKAKELEGMPAAPK